MNHTMRLHARQRLAANISVQNFLTKMGQLAAGLIPTRVSSNDCRVTVVRALAKDPTGTIVIVGMPAHPIHVLLVDHDQRIKADSFSGRLTPRGYECTLSNGEQTTLQVLDRVPVETFIKNEVEPLQRKQQEQKQALIDRQQAADPGQGPSRMAASVADLPFHGHVVPLASGLRVKCGGPTPRGLRCSVCSLEESMLKAGVHPLAARDETLIEQPDQPGVIARSESGPDEEFVLDLKLSFRDRDTYLSVGHMIAAMKWCGDVGHSAVVATFIDGDGAAHFDLDGLDSELQAVGSKMAEAASDYNDSLMALIGPNVAQAYSQRYAETGPQQFTRKTVYPPEKASD